MRHRHHGPEGNGAAYLTFARRAGAAGRIPAMKRPVSEASDYGVLLTTTPTRE